MVDASIQNIKIQKRQPSREAPKEPKIEEKRRVSNQIENKPPEEIRFEKATRFDKSSRSITPVSKPNSASGETKAKANSSKPAWLNDVLNSSSPLEPLEPKSSGWNERLTSKDIKAPAKFNPPQSKLEGLTTINSKPKYDRNILGQSTCTDDGLEDLLSGLSLEDKVEKPITEKDRKVPGLVPTLMDHQVQGLRFMLEREESSNKVLGGFLCDSMGLGKTVQTLALMVSNQAAKSAPSKQTLVICPKSIVPQWKAEVTTKTGLQAFIFESSMTAAQLNDMEDADVVVTNYEALVAGSKSKCNNILERKWFRVVCDEGHKLRNSKTRTFECISQLKCSGARWILTGTPVHNSTTDLYGELCFVGIKLWENMKAYRIDSRSNDSKMKVLVDSFSRVMLVRPPSILDSTLPKLNRHMVKFKLNEKEVDCYNLVQSSAALTSGSAFAKLFGLRQICSGHLERAMEVRERNLLKLSDFDDEEGHTAGYEYVEGEQGVENEWSSKTKQVVKLLEEEPERKTVIFATYLATLENIRNAIESKGYRTTRIYGKFDNKTRTCNLKTFSEDPDVSTMFCSLMATSEGLNITAGSRVIFAETWWNPMVIDQAVKRVHRIGQKSIVDVYELYADSSIEEGMMKLQDKKRKAAHNILHPPKKLTEEQMKELIYRRLNSTD